MFQVQHLISSSDKEKVQYFSESASGKWQLKYIWAILCITGDTEIFLDFVTTTTKRAEAFL